MKYIIAGLFTLCLAAGLRAGASRITTVQHVPTADILPHGKLQVQGAGGYFLTKGNDSSTNVAGVGARAKYKLGINDQFEGGMQAAANVSDAIKIYVSMNLRGSICEEQGWFLPNLAFGVENIIQAAEPGYYGIANDDTLGHFVNTVYLAATKTIEPLQARITGGGSASTMPGDRFTPFAAWEQYFGANLYLDAEFYKKLGLYQTGISAAWCSERVSLAVGLTNLHTLITNHGTATHNGYESMGLYLNLGLCFQVGEPRQKPGTECEDSLASLKLKLIKTEDQLHQTIMEKNYLANQAQAAKMADTRDTAQPDFDPKQAQAAVEKYLGEMALAKKSDLYDPAAVAAVMKKIVQYAEYSLPVLERVIKNPETQPATVIQAIGMVGQIGNKRSREMLLEVLNRKESTFKIEALIALGKLRDRTVIQYIKGALQDTDQMVAETARMVLESFGVLLEEEPNATPALAPAAPAPAPADTVKAKPPATPAPGKAKNGKR